MIDDTNHKLKVLIVEDSGIVTERISDFLSELDYIRLVGRAGNYEDACSIAMSFCPDVVLLDFKLPDNSGLDLLVELKKNHAARIIILSNHSEPHVRKLCNKAGADYFLDKTTEFEKIPDVLKAIHNLNEAEKKTRYEKALVIDDDELDIYITGRVIKEANFAKETVLKRSVCEAIDYLLDAVNTGEKLPEVIFLDLNFPGKNGFDFLNEFKKLCMAANVKSNILVLTNSLEKETEMELIAHNHPMIHAFLEKPLRVETLEGL